MSNPLDRPISQIPQPLIDYIATVWNSTPLVAEAYALDTGEDLPDQINQLPTWGELCELEQRLFINQLNRLELITKLMQATLTTRIVHDMMHSPNSPISGMFGDSPNVQVFEVLADQVSDMLDTIFGDEPGDTPEQEG